MAAEVKYCYRHPNVETGLSCTDCGRPICPDCATFAPVGIRCPEHSGRPQGAARVTRGVRRASYEGTGAVVTKALVAINVAIFLLELGLGGTLAGTANQIYDEGFLSAREVGAGDWHRLFSAMFLHYGPFHLAVNMFSLWIFGAVIEEALGRGRYLLLYLVSGLAGSAGALLLRPDARTVGASGAIFGILGAALVLERQGKYVLGGQALGIIAINLVITFAIPGISIGGHLGGLAGGALGILALSRFGRASAIYGRPGLVGIVGLAAIGIASIAVAYWRVQPYMT
jgi:membrane associated rhomboid family serine protease